MKYQEVIWDKHIDVIVITMGPDKKKEYVDRAKNRFQDHPKWREEELIVWVGKMWNVTNELVFFAAIGPLLLACIFVGICLLTEFVSYWLIEPWASLNFFL